ncbi:MAG: hypothetical protein EAX87_02270 [Candidatus Thorarchaeota archaeon]|nr:hypothetical protein [Candidatus Thorarchaeota archaeon]
MAETQMRFVDIKFSEREARPGGIISGVVVINTDKAFECNRVVLKIKGKERTELGGGEYSITDEVVLVKGRIVLCEAQEVSSGRSEFPFKFRLEEGLPPTYSGYCGWIEYSVEAVVEMDWTLDPKMTRRFRVLPIQPEYIPEVDGYSPINKDKDKLHIELQSDILRINKGILVRFMVEEHSRINGVRFEVRRKEFVKCRNSKDTHDVTLKRKFVPFSPDDFHEWQEEIVGEGWRRVPFKSKLIATTYFLKVVLEMRWEIDPFVNIPVRISGEKPDEDVDDIFDSIAYDLGFD